VFALPHEPGALFKALSVFALRDINLTKLESRPSRSRRWTYHFHVDIEGNANDKNIRNALSHLQETAPFLKVLGSYPIRVRVSPQ
jgi:prephenate dehydratase